MVGEKAEAPNTTSHFVCQLKKGILSYFVDWFDNKVARMG
jgi:hypothetical protein